MSMWWGRGIRPAGAEALVMFSENFAGRFLLCVMLSCIQCSSFIANLTLSRCGLSCFVGG